MRGLRLACLFAVLGLPLAAASFIVEGSSFNPANFRVGEETELVAVLRVTGPGAQAFEVAVGSGLPDPGPRADPEIRSIKLLRNAGTWELRLRFVPWSPGPGLIPAGFFSGNVLPAIRYSVQSVLGPGEREPSPPKPQREPAGTGIYLYGFAGLVILLVLALLAIFLWVLPGARRLLAAWKEAQAFRSLRRSLAYLSTGLEGGEGGAPSVSPEAFYAALARSLRLYLAVRVMPEAPALTPRELSALPIAAFPTEGLREDVAALLAESDDVRFGGERPGRTVMLAAIDRAQRIGETVEEALR